MVAERLWSAQDVKDTGNMYQRLAKIDAWSVVSAGLQQHAETARLMTRLSNSADIAPLLSFSTALEPAQYYTRQHIKFQAGHYTQAEPLNRLADALPAESNAVRELGTHVSALVQDPQNAQAAQAVRSQLESWQRSAEQVKPVLAQNYVLKPLQPVAQQLGALSANGLIWLEKLQKGETLNAQERQQAQSQLDDAAKVQDEVVLAVVYPLEKLLAGVK